jgi:hypothetical protein
MLLPSHLVHQHSPQPGGTLSLACPRAVFPTHPRRATRMGQTSDRDDLREAERFFSDACVWATANTSPSRTSTLHPFRWTFLPAVNVPAKQASKSGFRRRHRWWGPRRAPSLEGQPRRGHPGCPSRISSQQSLRLGRFHSRQGQRWDGPVALLVSADSDGGQFWRPPRGTVVPPIAFGQLQAVTRLGHLGFAPQSIAPRR